MTLTVNDPRGQLSFSEAITFAIEGMSRLPEEHRPKRDIEDMKALLSDAALPNLAHFQSEARRRVDVLLGIAPLDGQPVIRDRREAHSQCRAQQSYRRNNFRVDGKARAPLSHQTAGLRNIGTSAPSMAGLPTSNPPIGANGRSYAGGHHNRKKLPRTTD